MGKNYENMIAGRPFYGTDPELFERKSVAAQAKARLDAVPVTDRDARISAMGELLAPGSGPAMILPPFSIQYGRHVKLGKNTFVNLGATFLDSNNITLGNYVAVGPNVQFITDTHPIRPEDRFLPPVKDSPLPFAVANLALPITVGDYAWIGAGAILMPGVTIGEASVVAAGAVVTKDVPARTVVAGNPARFLRSVDDYPRVDPPEV